MLKIKYKFKVSLLLMLLIVFNSIYVDAAPATSIGDNGNIAPTIDLNVTPVKKPIVNFTIRGYKDSEMKYDYNLQQRPAEKTTKKPL